jgi:hypothetical protein
MSRLKNQRRKAIQMFKKNKKTDQNTYVTLNGKNYIYNLVKNEWKLKEL